MKLARVLTGAWVKGGRYEVWVHVITESALCIDQLEMTDEGELVDMRPPRAD